MPGEAATVLSCNVDASLGSPRAGGRLTCFSVRVIAPMRYFRAVLLIPFAVVLVISVSGCGSSSSQQQRLSKSEYQQKLLEIMRSQAAREASALFGEIVLGDPVTGPIELRGRACSKSAREFAGSIHEIVDSVAALKPPRKIEVLQSRFLKDAEVSVAKVDEAARDAEAGQLACGRDMNKRIYGLPSTLRAEATVALIEKEGYFVFGK